MIGENNPNWKGGKINIICKQCGHEFDGYLSQNKIFCCQDCYSEWQSKNKTGKNHHSYNQITLICEWCGHEYTRNKAAVEASHFCCQDCYSEWQSKNKTGKNNSQWKGGKNITLICKQCGHKYIVYKKSQDKSKFCSVECFNDWQRINPKIGINNKHYGSTWTEEQKQRCSARQQGILYEEWEAFASESPYCPLFNNKCRESNREKYDRKCFLCNKLEEENITKNGKQKKLSVHHVDMDKMQGCDGKRWKLIPTCIHCHGKVHNELWQFRIMWLLENVWNKN